MQSKPFTITIAQAIAWLEALQRTLALQERIPLKYAQTFRRNIVALASNPDVAAAMPSRIELMRRYGTESNGTVTVQPENFTAYACEWEPIALQTITVELAPLPLSLEDSPVVMSGNDVLMLTGLWQEQE